MAEVVGAMGKSSRWDAPVRRSTAQDDFWYILRTLSRREFDAERQLLGSGYRVFVPREIKWRRPTMRYLRRKVQTVEYVRFPGYTFVAMDAAASTWWRIRALPLVRGILGIAGRPVALAPGEIDRLIAEDGTTVPHANSVPVHRAITPGMSVRICDGPFKDHVVTVDRISRRGAHASLRFLCAEHELNLPLEWLESAA